VDIVNKQGSRKKESTTIIPIGQSMKASTKYQLLEREAFNALKGSNSNVGQQSFANGE